MEDLLRFWDYLNKTIDSKSLHLGLNRYGISEETFCTNHLARLNSYAIDRLFGDLINLYMDATGYCDYYIVSDALMYDVGLDHFLVTNLLETYTYLVDDYDSEDSDDYDSEDSDDYFIPAAPPVQTRRIQGASNRSNSATHHTFTTQPQYPSQDYSQRVQYARNQLINYYGSASSFFPAAQADLIHVDRMSPDEIIREAQRKGLIK